MLQKSGLKLKRIIYQSTLEGNEIRECEKLNKIYEQCKSLHKCNKYIVGSKLKLTKRKNDK